VTLQKEIGMRMLTSVLAAGFLFALASASRAEEIPVTADMVKRLAASAWKSQPAGALILVTRERVSNAATKSSPAKTMLHKRRITVLGDSFRMDDVELARTEDDPGTFAHTWGNVAANGSVPEYSYTIYHSEKQAMLSPSPMHVTDYAGLGRHALRGGDGLWAVLGKVEKTADGKITFVPDDTQMKAIVSGQAAASASVQYHLTAQSGKSQAGHDVTIFTETAVVGDKQKPLARWTLDAANYDICYSIEHADPKDGTWRTIAAADSFQKLEGTDWYFPRHASLKEYNMDGSVRSEIDITVREVALDAGLKASDLAFSIPEGYTVSDGRPEQTPQKAQ
jgi:hypothetical protein